MECRSVLRDLILDMGQLEFAQVPVEGWLIDPNEHSLLDIPSSAVCLPTSYGKNVPH